MENLTEQKNCKQCGKDFFPVFYKYRKLSDFCSQSCSARFGFLNNNPSKLQSVKDKLSKIFTGRKVTWGKKISDSQLKAYQNGRVSPFTEIWKNDPNFLKGENHPKWKKDRTQLKSDRDKSYDTQYKYWMLEVKKRDGWKCKISNSDCKGRIEAHHILSWREHPELRYEKNNGITLCYFHHPRKRVDEAKLSPFFQELVNKIS